MRTKTLFPVFSILVISAMLFTACNLPGASNGLDQDQIEMAIEMTLQAMELNSCKRRWLRLKKSPTPTAEPVEEAVEAVVEEEPVEEELHLPTPPNLKW